MSNPQPDEIIEAERCHDLAMEEMDGATIARLNKRSAEEREHINRAFELEKKAAEIIAPYEGFEPSRAILHRSAATLAIRAGQVIEAQRLIHRALSGFPCKEHADELYGLLEEVTFKRHLNLKGQELLPAEFQLSLEGAVTSYGRARADVFQEHLNALNTILQRTLCRYLKQPFEEYAASRNSIALFLAVPEPGSYSIRVQVAVDKEYSNFLGEPSEDSIAAKVVEEAFECLTLYQQADVPALQARIPDESYYKNFVSLSQRLAADGKKINTVGLTMVDRGKEQAIALRKPKPNSTYFSTPTKNKKGKEIILTGRLKFADAGNPTANKIAILHGAKDKTFFLVPSGMMNDIVRPLWDQQVTVKGMKDGKNNALIDIFATDDYSPELTADDQSHVEQQTIGLEYPNMFSME